MSYNEWMWEQLICGKWNRKEFAQTLPEWNVFYYVCLCWEKKVVLFSARCYFYKRHWQLKKDKSIWTNPKLHFYLRHFLNNTGNIYCYSERQYYFWWRETLTLTELINVKQSTCFRWLVRKKKSTSKRQNISVSRFVELQLPVEAGVGPNCGSGRLRLPVGLRERQLLPQHQVANYNRGGTRHAGVAVNQDYAVLCGQTDSSENKSKTLAASRGLNRPGRMLTFYRMVPFITVILVQISKSQQLSTPKGLKCRTWKDLDLAFVWASSTGKSKVDHHQGVRQRVSESHLHVTC